jgi:V/A-type H+-transporting ATPase subunit E
MENNIDELTQKIYQEGIAKANKERDRIIDEALKKADKIIEVAKKDAQAIALKAENEASVLKSNSLSEIKLAGKQAISSLKQEIKHLISEKVLTKNISNAFEDGEFLKNLILEVVKEWRQASGINITLSQDLQSKIDTAFEESLIKEIKDLEINFDKKLKGGFIVSQSGKTYQITFSDDDFVEFFKPFLREKAKEILFN